MPTSDSSSPGATAPAATETGVFFSPSCSWVAPNRWHGSSRYRPGYASTLRKRYREHGSAGLVAVSGRKAVLTAEVVATARGLLEGGWSQTQLAGRWGVSPSALSKALSRHPAPAGPAQAELEVRAGPVLPQQDRADPGGAHDATASTSTADQDTGTADQDTGTADQDTSTAEDSIQDLAQGADPADQAEGAVGEAGPAVAPRITEGVFASRYAGAMLAHAYLDRIGAPAVLTGLPETPWRRYGQARIACHTVLALLLGVGSIEQVKTLARAQAGPLTGTPLSPELHTLRPRLMSASGSVVRQTHVR